MKKILTLVLFLTVISSSLLLTSCKDSILDPGTVANPNYYEYEISLKEYILPADSNAFNALTGRIVADLSGDRDIEMPDSSGGSGHMYLRSGDGTNPTDVIGYETKFTTGWNISHAAFDTLSTYYNNTGAITPLDFTSHTTFRFDVGIANPYLAYGFYLKGRSEALANGYNIYGMLYIDTIETLPNGSRRVTLHVKLNTHGLNDFRPYVPVS
ncbi:hypothetical protein BH10BAC5_BH10BAC5_13080 [soil metagenome]